MAVVGAALAVLATKGCDGAAAGAALCASPGAMVSSAYVGLLSLAVLTILVGATAAVARPHRGRRAYRLGAAALYAVALTFWLA
ncbi:hypothetical protein ACVU7I_02895 [Patulibacter sp. S7RM1-6]